MADALRSVVSDLVLISSAPGAVDWLPGVPVVPDSWRTRGSLVGIHAALAHVGRPILLTAWDMPFVTPALVAHIRDRAETAAFASIPERDAGLEPFCAAYTPACLPWIEAALREDDLRLTNLLARLPHVDRIAADEIRALGDPERLFFNVNSPLDLARAEELAASR